MLENLLGEYLDSLDGREREFDAPFIALLRASGYTDIHFTHGQFEFGKDFLAKGTDADGTVCQFVFQTKGGNVGLNDWHPIRGQVDQLRTNEIAHPSFDPELPRKPVLVITGRLVGGAIPEAQQYRRHLERMREPGFILWDREDLVGMLMNSPSAGLAGDADGDLLKVLGQIKRREITRELLEEYSRCWIVSLDSTNLLLKSAIEAGVISSYLIDSRRLDLACLIGLCLVRAGWASSHGEEPADETAVVVADLGRMLFELNATSVWQRCSDDLLDPAKMLANNEGAPGYVTAPVRCLTIAETLGLYGLNLIEQGRRKDAEEVVVFLSGFFQRVPPATRPISDKWAISLVAPSLLLAATGRKEEVREILKTAVQWTCDRYDSNGFGIAGPTASAEEEVNYLLGAPFEHVPLSTRTNCYLTPVALDISAVLQLGDLYEDIRNDFEAVGAYPYFVDTADSLSQYVTNGGAVRKEFSYMYRERWNPVDGWKVAAHHERYSAVDFYLVRQGRLWEHLAISSVLRDRHWVHTWRQILEKWSQTAPESV